VILVHAGRFSAAPRAPHRPVLGPRPHADHLAPVLDILDDQGRQPRNTVPTSSVTSIMTDRDTSAQSATAESATGPLKKNYSPQPVGPNGYEMSFSDDTEAHVLSVLDYFSP
jgi:hypothetical protein